MTDPESLRPILGWYRYEVDRECAADIVSASYEMLDTPRANGDDVEGLATRNKARILEHALVRRIGEVGLGRASTIPFRDPRGGDVTWDGKTIEVKSQGYSWWEVEKASRFLHFYRHRAEIDLAVTAFWRETPGAGKRGVYDVLFKQVISVPAIFDPDRPLVGSEPPLNERYWRLSESPRPGKERVRLFDHRRSREDGVGIVF